MGAAVTYYNFMENTIGLGPTGTHLIHAGAAGGVTYAVGRYGGVSVIADNWWAPFAGAFAGLGLSVLARWMASTEEFNLEMLDRRLEKDMKRLGKETQAKVLELRRALAECAPDPQIAASGNV